VELFAPTTCRARKPKENVVSATSENPPPEIAVLFPAWSEAQWAAIGSLVAASTGSRLSLLPVPPEAVLEELASRTQSGTAPDLVMLPAAALDPCKRLPIRPVHADALRLREAGAAIIETDRGVAVGVTTFWAPEWFVAATNDEDSTLTALLHAGAHRDPRRPTSPIYWTRLLFHEQVLQLPQEWGGGKFTVHFDGRLDLEVEVADADPTQAAIRVLGLRGTVGPEALSLNLAELPAAKAVPLEGLEGFSLSLLSAPGSPENGGTIDYRTGATFLRFGARVSAPFFEKVAWDPIDLEIKEQGQWDLRAGTLYLETGSISLVGGPVTGVSFMLLSGSKNETKTVVTATRSEWQALEVEVLEYGTKPEDQDALEKARKLFEKLSKKGAQIGALMSKAVSVKQAKSVFVTYGCVVTETFQDQEKKDGQWKNLGDPSTDSRLVTAVRVELSDAEALPWWQSDGRQQREYEAAITRNRPKTPCPPP
jgi:hypothetical protein